MDTLLLRFTLLYHLAVGFQHIVCLSTCNWWSKRLFQFICHVRCLPWVKRVCVCVDIHSSAAESEPAGRRR